MKLKAISAILALILTAGCKINPSLAEGSGSKGKLNGSYRFERNGWVYVHLEGSPRRVGYQHGYHLSEEVADQSSERERAAAAAERELMDWRKADFMAEHVGERFEGVITSVKEYGLFVELNEVYVEGLVHVSTIRDDEYEYQPRKHRLVGRRGGRAYRLGDSIIVMVDRVDRTRHLVDFSIAL